VHPFERTLAVIGYSDVSETRVATDRSIPLSAGRERRGYSESMPI